VPTSIVGIVFFVGSIFFTSAGYSTLVLSVNADIRKPGEPWRLIGFQPHRVDWWASIVQFAGTLWFNVNTFNAMKTGLTVHEQNRHIWGPDFVGSICFLVASWLFWSEVGGPTGRGPGLNTPWWINALNMLGSVFYMLSAIAAFVLPDTGDLLNATIANMGTLLGALCFFWAARLLLKPQRVG
jgi:hypothetical protein